MHLLLVLTVLLVAPAAVPPVTVQSGTLYVAPWGNDAADCAFETPCLTLTRAAGLAGPGTTVHARGGVYEVVAEQDIRVTGTAQAPIVFSAFPGEFPVLDGTNAVLGQWDGVVQIVQSSHVVFEGFEVCCSPERGIVVAESEYVTISGNFVHETQERAIGGGGDHITISDNVVDRAMLRNGDLNSSSGWSSAISSGPRWDGSPSYDWTVVRNTVTRSYGECLNAYLVIGFTYSWNTADGCYSVDLYIDRSREGLVEGNVLLATIPGFERRSSGNPAVGIMIAAEQGTLGITPTNITIHGNTIGGGVQGGVKWWQDPNNPEPWNTYERIVITANRIGDVRAYAASVPALDPGSTPPCCSVFAFNTIQSWYEFGDPGAWTILGNRPPSRPLQAQPW